MANVRVIVKPGFCISCQGQNYYGGESFVTTETDAPRYGSARSTTVATTAAVTDAKPPELSPAPPAEGTDG